MEVCVVFSVFLSVSADVQGLNTGIILDVKLYDWISPALEIMTKINRIPSVFTPLAF